MAIDEKLDEMCTRLIGGEPDTIQRKITIYSSGVKAKLKYAQYALEQLKVLNEWPDNHGSHDCPDFSVPEKIQFYVDAFFAFLYSTLDIISQVINQKHRLGVDEKRVSLRSIKRELVQSTNPAILPIKDKLAELVKKRFFKNLDKYRNCSTHRRQIFIIAISMTITETPGYSSTGEVSEVVRMICDDPLSLNPKTDQKRELIKYCSKVLDRVTKEIEGLSVVI